MNQFFNAPDENMLRNKIAMVLFSFEKNIGDKLKEAHRSLSSQVAASFFQDLLELACKSFAGTDKESDYTSLKQIALSYDACEIRNAISHPNRGVTDNHWFRTAAIASSPLIEKLQLRLVSEALASAIEGQLSVPPDYWFLRETRALPNSLPERSEHDVTGFVGRKQDIKKLRGLVENPRCPAVAVVGPGGTGKTALALCVLNDLVHDTTVRGWCDALIYISAKREELTADGIRQWDIDTSIHNVASQFATLAKELGCEQHFNTNNGDTGSNRSIIVCVDNFETVLAEDEEASSKLNALLPASAKLLLTSRVRVDGATTMPLGNLQEGDAVGLAGRYAERVVGTELPTNVKQAIASSLNGSPLAIKLAIDLYARNQTLSEATEKARQDVLGFSFTNLIDKLTDVEIKVIEALFVSEGPSRLGEIISLVNEDREMVLQAVSSLSRTSLVIREHTDGGDSYFLNENIRGLVRKNSRHIKFRPELQRRLRDRADKLQRHESIQQGHDVTEQDEFFVSPSLPAHLQHLLISAIPILRKKTLSSVGEWFEQADNSASECAPYASFHYFYGRMLGLVGDAPTALKAMRQALDIQPTHIWSRLCLAENLISSPDAVARKQAPRELETVLSVADTWQDREYGRFWSLYYGSLERVGEFEQLRQLATSNCIKAGSRFLNYHVTYAGYGECKCVANIHAEDPGAAQAGFEAAFEWLQRLPDVEHITPRDVKRVLLIFKELSHFLQINEERCDLEWAHARLESVAVVAELLFSRGYLTGEAYDDCLECIEKFVEFPIGRENPCRFIGWAKHLWTTPECTQEQLQLASSQGLVVARASKGPKGQNFFIATCVSTNETILCHINSVHGGGAEFRRVRPNDLVVIRVGGVAEESPRASWWTRFSSWEVSPVTE